MEVIVRIAEEKYLKPQLEKNMTDATKRILEECCVPEFKKYSAQGWRDDQYWNEKCDDCLKHYKV